MRQFVLPVRRHLRGGDDGFSLMETIVGLVMLSVVLVAVIPFFIGVLRATAGLGSKQAGLAVASQQLELVRSIQPANLLLGRSVTNVTAADADRGLVDFSGDDLTVSANSDPGAASNAVAVPLSNTVTVGPTKYTVRTFIHRCYLNRAASASDTKRCTASSSNGPVAYRVSVDVSWPKRAGVTCTSGRSGTCEYVATTLVDATSNPQFNVNAAPSITGVSAVPASAYPLHPQQQLTLQVNGSNFVYGATVTTGSGDVVGSTSNQTASSLQVPYQASSVLGSRSLVVANPDGRSGSFTVTIAQSTPTLTSLSLSAIQVGGPPVVFTLSGGDFFTTPPPTGTTTVQPTVTYTVAGDPTTRQGSGVSVVNATTLRFSAALAASGSVSVTVTNPDGGTATRVFSVIVL